jgi:mRNA-degrading endonuclease RelE of RelBE toxin-antitoxin system
MSNDGWTWELSSTAEDDIDGLPPADQDRILDKLDEIVSSPGARPAGLR